MGYINFTETASAGTSIAITLEGKESPIKHTLINKFYFEFVHESKAFVLICT